MQKLDNTKIIIGVDHGYGNMKTAHRVFKTGVGAWRKNRLQGIKIPVRIL